MTIIPVFFKFIFIVFSIDYSNLGAKVYNKVMILLGKENQHWQTLLQKS